MSNYSTAVPANRGFTLPLPLFKSSSAQSKRLRQEASIRSIVIDGQDFRAIDIQTMVEDVQNTSFNQYLAEAVQYMEEHAPIDLVKQALPILYLLNEKTTSYEVMNFPPLSVSLPSAVELLFEWNFEHFSIGISFEKNSEESGYYIVHDGTVKKMTAWGYLNSQPVAELVNIIMSQVLENAAAP